jgi:PAS domain S-box-containing protein
MFGVGMTDLEGFVTYANEAAVKMWGYGDKAEVLGRPLVELWEGEGVHETMEALRAGGGRAGVDTGKRKDGTTFPVLFSASVIKDSKNKPICTFGSFIDLTEQQRAEAAKRALEEQIQKAQKLESLGVLAGGIAHDFNNLLVGILGNADLALTELPPGSPVREIVADIVSSAERAAELAKQMLAYSGKGGVLAGNVDLRSMVEEMAHLLEAAVSRKTNLKLEFGDNVPPVRADVAQLRQVVLDLVTNASEAIGDAGGSVTLTTGVMECDRAYLSNTYVDDNLPEGDFSYFEVADNGCGMSEDIVSRIFDPFFTTKFTGRGLGLAAVLGIVRGHEGAINIHSTPGKGTTVRVLFPAVGASAAAGDDSELPGMPGGRTVLLVDDEATVRAVGTRMLEKLDLEVLTADSGLAALEIFEADPGRVDLVVLDLTMPIMDGEECLRELQRIRPDVRVLLSSGYNERELIDRFLGKGLAGFIQKPFQLSYLSQKIKSALRAKKR